MVNRRTAIVTFVPMKTTITAVHKCIKLNHRPSFNVTGIAMAQTPCCRKIQRHSSRSSHQEWLQPTSKRCSIGNSQLIRVKLGTTNSSIRKLVRISSRLHTALLIQIRIKFHRLEWISTVMINLRQTPRLPHRRTLVSKSSRNHATREVRQHLSPEITTWRRSSWQPECTKRCSAFWKTFQSTTTRLETALMRCSTQPESWISRSRSEFAKSLTNVQFKRSAASFSPSIDTRLQLKSRSENR